MSGSGPRHRACPTLSRWVERHPELEAALEVALAAAEAVRHTKSAAFPDRPSAPPLSPALGGLERRLCEATRALERLAREGCTEGEAASAVGDVLAVLAELRALGHPRAPLRRSASTEARRRLVAALRQFAAALAELRRLAAATHTPMLPWQLTLATHIAPGTPVRELALAGYELAMTPAAELAWGERCLLSGRVFATDSHPEPALRYRSLDAFSHVLEPRFHALVSRLRAALEQLRTRSPEVVARALRFAPFLAETYVAERANPTFLKLGLADYPSFAVTVNNALRTFAERPFLGVRDGEGGWSGLGGGDCRWLSFAEVRERSLGLAHGLDRLGLEPGQRLGFVTATNRPETALLDLAALFANLVTVGLQESFDPQTTVGVAARSELRALVTDVASCARLAPALGAGACPQLETILLVDGDEAERGSFDDLGRTVIPFRTVISPPEAIAAGWSSASGIALDTDVVYGDPEGWTTAAASGIPADGDDDLYTIVFTSGSTGRPKGTLISRRRWIEEMRLDSNAWPHVDVSYRSPALASDRRALLQALVNGGRVGFARRGGAGLLEDLRAIRPTLFDAPPAIWSIVAARYRAEASDPELGVADLASLRLRLREELGGRLAVAGIGGAGSDPALRATIEASLDASVVEGYGTTETGEIAFNGQLVRGLDYRLVDLPELGFTSADRPHPRGELAVRTAHTTARYLEDGAESREAFTDDGYFLTGDIVEIGPGRACRVIGRRKEIFKLAGAEFVAPAAVEEALLASELVDELFVTALPGERAVVGVVVPAREGLTAEAILADLRRLAADAGLRPCETPLAVVVEPRTDDRSPWTPASGLRTASLKLRRPALAERYRDAVAAAYARAGAEPPPPPAASTDRLELARRRITTVVAALLRLDPTEVDLTRSFAELGGDSLATLDYRLRLERLLVGEGVGPDELDRLLAAPLEEAALRLDRRRDGGGAASSTPRDRLSAAAAAADQVAIPAADPVALATADAEAPLHLDPLPSPAGGGAILVTGATGFIGAHLLTELATSLTQGRRCIALVRASDDRAACARLTAALDEATLGPLPLASGLDSEAAVTVVAGDLTHPRLGLADGAYQRLAAEVGLVHHVAAEVDLARPYSRLREANAEGTRRVLELVTSRRLKALHFVSSLDAAFLLEGCGLKALDDAAPLAQRLPQAAAHGSGYALSKWVGERLVQRAVASSEGRLHASISRPALVVWPPASGYANRTDWLTLLLRSCLELRLAIGDDVVGVPAYSAPSAASARGLELVPVDFVAAAIARLGELTERGVFDANGAAPAFNLGNPCPGEEGLVSPRRLMALLAASDLARSWPRSPIGWAPLAEWRLRAAATGAPIVPLIPLLERLLRPRPRCPTRRLEAALAALPGRPAPLCAAISRELVDAFVARHLAPPGGRVLE